MALRDMYRKTLVSSTLNPSARVTGTFNGTGIDLRGYDAAVLSVLFGTWTDGTHTPSVQHSVDGSTYTAASASDLDGAFSAVSSSGGSNTVQSVGYVGSKRYVRVVMIVTGATTGAVSGAAVIAGYPRSAPIV